MAEGFRRDDIMRWAAHKLIIGKRPKGIFYSDELKKAFANLAVDAGNFLDPYRTTLTGPGSTWGFDPAKHYLLPIPINEMTLNPAIKQNPGY